MIAGVDGCEDGWMVVVEREGAQFDAFRVPSFGALLDQHELSLVVIDIPIGLLDRGVRGADRAARALLGRRSSCVFNAPLRPMLDARDYAEASAISRSIDGKGCSKQSFALMPKIRDVDDAVQRRNARARIVEGHPEVSFAIMNGGIAIETPKRFTEGERIRLHLLAEHLGADVEAVVRSQSARYSTDVVDALAMLWTARRVRSGEAVKFPVDREIDSRGIAACISA